jgi:hypothetical protein
MKTVAQQIQYQRATMIARLQALDPERVAWQLSDPYEDLRAACYYLLDRKAAR